MLELEQRETAAALLESKDRLHNIGTCWGSGGSGLRTDSKSCPNCRFEYIRIPRCVWIP